MKASTKAHIQYVDAIVRTLALEDLGELVNGCGSEKFWLRWARFPRRYCQLFRDHCNWHDIAYYVGGNEKHKQIADFEFYRRMVGEAGIDVLGQVWAILGWRAVSRGGKLSFEYRKKPAKLDYLQAIAAARRAERENR